MENNMIRERYNRFIQKFPYASIDMDATPYVPEYTYIKDGEAYNLTSVNGMDKPVQCWCDQFKDVHYNTVFCIFGMGYPQYLIELHHRYPDNSILCFEPCDENIKRLVASSYMNEIIECDNLVIIAGTEKYKNLEGCLNWIIRYENMEEVRYACIPNYKKIWEEEYEQYMQLNKQVFEKIAVDRNTLIQFEQNMGRNYLYNLQHMVCESDLWRLKSAFVEKAVKQYPAVIISAGPSLDKNIDALSDYVGRTLLICVDAALNTVYKHGIKPDIVVSVDPNIDRSNAMRMAEYHDLPYVLDLVSSYKITSEARGRLFYALANDRYTLSLAGVSEEEVLDLESGGSVANSAFSLAKILGFQTIILIGQDLSYPDNKLHAEDAFKDEKELDVNDDKYFYIEDIYGNQVLTEYNMKMYRDWFENRIENYPELSVIDATEGGALIKGTQIMTLSDALKKTCPLQKENWAQLIDGAEYLVPMECREEAQNKMTNMRAELGKYLEKIKSGREIYNQLDILNRKGKYGTKEFRNCLKQLQEFTQSVEQSLETELFRRFVNQASYEMRENIEKDEKNTYEDIKKVVMSGYKMIDAYLEAGEKIENEWKYIDHIE